MGDLTLGIIYSNTWVLVILQYMVSASFWLFLMVGEGLIPDLCAPDIRDIAHQVNDRLKKLILPEDDEDTVTDAADQSRESTPLLGRKAIPTGQAGQTGPLGASPQRVPAGPGGKVSHKLGTVRTSSPNPPPLPITNGPVTSQTTSETGQTRDTSSPTVAATQTPQPQESVPSHSGATESSDGGAGAEEVSKLPTKQTVPKLHLLTVVGVLIRHMKYTQQETRMETLRWVIWLHEQLPKRVGTVGL